MQSFASGQVISLSGNPTPQASGPVQPYSPNLEFNKVINARNDKPENVIFSIDIGRFLRVVKGDDLGELHKITLACRPSHEGVGIWDTLFNSSQYRASTAAVMVARGDFKPIPRERVTSQPAFLSLTHPTSRTHLNKLVRGDWVGIAIRDAVAGFTYIFLYEVEDTVRIRTKPSDTMSEIVVPAVNVTMHHALRLDHADPDKAVVIPMDDRTYDHDVAGPFVSCLDHAVDDIRNASVWKPHFLSYVPSELKRQVIEDRLTAEIPKAKAIAYSDFEEKCRALYQTAGRNQPEPAPKPQNNPQGKKGNQKHARPQPVLPIIEVVSVDDTYYVTLDDTGMVKFTKEDMGSRVVMERHLTNQDLENTLVKESSNVMILSSSFGENAYLRYFTVNF